MLQLQNQIALLIFRPVYAMKVTQTLASGTVIEQNFSSAVRPVFFHTDLDEFLYATHGGTLFIVNFRDKLYAITCGHVFKDFPHGMLFVTQEKQAKKGSMPAHVTGICYPSSPNDALEGSDVSDICVIEFSDDTRPEFFKGSAYIFDEETVATSNIGDELYVAGVLKDKTAIIPPDISIGYCNLSFRDCGPTSDPILRRAFALFAEHLFGKPQFSSVTGISGAPVFNKTANALCGMVIRGAMNGPACTIYYVDAFDILRLLEAVSTRAHSIYYTKHVVVPVQRVGKKSDHLPDEASHEPAPHPKR
jgi:hypothetical protein